MRIYPLVAAALALAVALPGRAQDAEPIIDGDHPRDYRIDFAPDMRGKIVSHISTRNQVDAVTSQQPPMRIKPVDPPVPIPVLAPEFQEHLKGKSAIALEKIHVQLKRVPSIPYLANKTPDEVALLAQQVDAEGSREQNGLVHWIGAHGGRVLSQTLFSGSFTAMLPVGAIPSLAKHPDVAAVEEDVPGQAGMNVARDMINAGIVYNLDGTPKRNPDGTIKTGFWEQQGAKGEGVTVAVIDTGINGPDPDPTNPYDYNGQHPGLTYLPDGSLRYLWAVDYAPYDCDPTSYDIGSHGTRVASVAVGSGNSSWLFGATNYGTIPVYAGIAPNSRLRSFKVAQKDPDCVYRGAFDYEACRTAFSYSSHLADGVINNSYGFKVGGTDTGTSSLDLAADAAFDAGTAVIAIPQNGGPSLATGRVSPGDARKALSIGAIGSGEGVTPQWHVAGYSGRGPTLDGRTKPDLVAPTEVIAAFPAQQYSFGWSHGFYVGAEGGTSFSAPMASGAAALWISRFNQPGLGGISPGALYSLLLATADWTKVIDDTTPGYAPSAPNAYSKYTTFSEDNVIGAGVLDLGSYTINSTLRIITNQLTGQPISPTSSNPRPVHTYSVVVPPGAKRLSVALWWPDRRDNVTGYQHSDLDLWLIKPNGVFAGIDDAGPPVSARVGVVNPVAGTWTVNVQAYSIPTVNGSNTQTYHLTAAIKM